MEKHLTPYISGVDILQKEDNIVKGTLGQNFWLLEKKINKISRKTLKIDIYLEEYLINFHLKMAIYSKNYKTIIVSIE